MEFKIKSRKLGRTVTFSRPSKSYIFVDLNKKEGILGLQICKNGKLHGSTITYEGNSQKDFERVCRKWWRNYLRNIREGC